MSAVIIALLASIELCLLNTDLAGVRQRRKNLIPQTRDIEAFKIVTLELDFLRVDGRTGIDQSTLSRRIGQLEGLMGDQLVRRTTREVSLIAAGEVSYERTSVIITTNVSFSEWASGRVNTAMICRPSGHHQLSRVSRWIIVGCTPNRLTAML